MNKKSATNIQAEPDNNIEITFNNIKNSNDKYLSYSGS